jgi:hypothetical protein
MEIVGRFDQIEVSERAKKPAESFFEITLMHS